MLDFELDVERLAADVLGDEAQEPAQLVRPPAGQADGVGSGAARRGGMWWGGRFSRTATCDGDSATEGERQALQPAATAVRMRRLDE